jgi:levansucrase
MGSDSDDSGQHADRRFLTTRWQARPSDLLTGSLPSAAVLTRADIRPILESHVFWDIWPVLDDDGSLADVPGGELWVALSAPLGDDPELRHNQARMRLVQRIDGHWRDCGMLLPDGLSPGSREWSGSTRLDVATGRVTLWFTAAGRAGDAGESFEQRLFWTRGQLDLTGPQPRVVDWSRPVPIAEAAGLYAATDAGPMSNGMIGGFRDPFWFRDPASDAGYVVFTGTKARPGAGSDFAGVIGLARATERDGLGPFELLPPLIDGEGQVNELELPHLRHHDGLYYLFWSSHARVFAPGGLEGPTGLYGMCAPSLRGPYTPLNGSGLVLANPPEEPQQAYAWHVLPSLEVVGFVDYWGLEGEPVVRGTARAKERFGGTPAPFTCIALSGATSRVVA